MSVGGENCDAANYGPFASQINCDDCDYFGHPRMLVRWERSYMRILLKHGRGTDSSSSGDDVDDINDIYASVAVVGDSNVGKTTLLYRVLRSEFKSDRHETIGCDYEMLRVMSRHPHYDRPTMVKLVDTAGTEKYGAYAKQALRGIDGILLVFNAMDRTSFQNIVDKWNAVVDDRNPYCIKTLVATHIDLYSALPAEKRWMDHIDMIGRARALGCKGGFHAVSSCTGTHVLSMMSEVIDGIIKHQKSLEEELEEEEKERQSNSIIRIRAQSKEYHKTCVC